MTNLSKACAWQTLLFCRVLFYSPNNSLEGHVLYVQHPSTVLSFQKMEKDLITLNIGGTVFKTLRSTLKKFPHSKLGKLKSSSRNYINSSNEYFFDRSPELFNVILDYYRSEDIQLHIPSYICGSVLIRELEFWEIPIRNISDCCFRIYTDYQNGEDIRKNIDIHKITRVQQKQNQSFQDRAWLLLDQPRTSFGAMVNMMY